MAKNKKVVVTGGAGFIGSHLAGELVRRGYHVTILDDLSTGNRENIAAKVFYKPQCCRSLSHHAPDNYQSSSYPA